MIDPSTIERHLNDAAMYLHNDGRTDRAQREAREALDLMQKLDDQRRTEASEATEEMSG